MCATGRAEVVAGNAASAITHDGALPPISPMFHRVFRESIDVVCAAADHSMISIVEGKLAVDQNEAPEATLYFKEGQEHHCDNGQEEKEDEEVGHYDTEPSRARSGTLSPGNSRTPFRGSHMTPPLRSQGAFGWADDLVKRFAASKPIEGSATDTVNEFPVRREGNSPFSSLPAWWGHAAPPTKKVPSVILAVSACNTVVTMWLRNKGSTPAGAVAMDQLLASFAGLVHLQRLVHDIMLFMSMSPNEL